MPGKAYCSLKAGFAPCLDPPPWSLLLQVNKAFEKFEKQVKAAKSSGKDAKQKQEKVGGACLPA